MVSNASHNGLQCAPKCYQEEVDEKVDVDVGTKTIIEEETADR